MNPPRSRHSTRAARVVSSMCEQRRKTSLANGLPENHGESRAQVLESGGRVDKGVTTKRGVQDGTGDSGREVAHHARSIPRMDSGGLKLSVGMPQTPDAVCYRDHFPSQGKMIYGRK